MPMITWLMGAWLLYHLVAGWHFYGNEAATPSSLEAAMHEGLAVLDLGSLIGASGPAFIITYGAIITFAILVALYCEMSRIVRYGLEKNFSRSQYDLYGSIFLLVVTSVELFFVPLAWTSIFVILFFASIMDVLVHVRYLHYFVRPGRA
jgi:Trk-type K+ transport system membrane component